MFEFEAIKQAKSQKAIPTDNSEKGTPYIVQSTSNNMFSRNVNKQWLIDNNEAPVSGNRIVLGVTLPAVSYQPREFGASQVITAKSNWLNKNNGNFISIAISKLMYQFSYNRKPGLQIYKDLKIQLPTKNGKIDFDFMENFINYLETERIVKLDAYLVENGLHDYELSAKEKQVLLDFEKDKIKFGEFKIGDLFERIKTKKVPYKASELKTKPTGNYVLPCLTCSFNNQGLNYYAPKDDLTILKNVISLPSDSDVYRAYYQPKDFTILNSSYAIQWIFDNKKILPNQYLFAVQCINKVTDLPIYSYKNKLGGWNVVQHKYIQLPIKNSKPDYEIMNTLISAIKKMTIKDVVLYVKNKGNC
ncbi:hypothetical protein PJW08_10125 [Tenacibaculum finnmarkense]|nr:hypothetical protein PJW08_10125 [Tenacibaculum finnmarkense]